MIRSRIYPFLFVLLIFGKTLFSQSNPIDSLRQVLKTAKEDTNKINALWQLGRELYMKGDFDTAIVLEERADELAQKLSYTKGIASANKIAGNIHGVQGNYPQALAHYYAAVTAYKKMGNQKGVASTYNNIGLVYERQGNYVEALKMLLISLKSAEEAEDKLEMGSSHFNIGNVFFGQEQYDKALMHYQTALKLMEAVGNKRNANACYTGIGDVYAEKKNYPEALKYYNLALKIKDEINDPIGLAGLYNNMAFIYSEQGNYRESLKQLFSALKLCEEINDVPAVASACTNIGEVYMSLKKPAEAMPWLQKGLAAAKTTGDKSSIKASYKQIACADTMLGNYKEAYYHFKLYNIYKDSLLNEETFKQTTELQTKYDTEKKENQIEKLQQQEEIRVLELEQKNAQLKERNLIVALVLVTFLMLVFTGILLFRYQHVKHIQKVNQAEENERRRMAKDLHDDLGSGLSKIKFVSEKLSSKANSNPELVSGIDTIADTSMRLVENMHDLIWAMNPENTTLDGLVAHIREYGSDYLSETGQQLSLHIPNSIPAEKINHEAHRNIFFIAKEALQNIVKHAQATQVEMTVNFNNSRFNLHIADNGKGISQENTQGNGLLNMKHRAENIGGNFNIHSSEQGTTIVLEIPLSKLVRIA
ncbi:MAG: sensor histidine kinase [Bacteroidetes bacterium]|nr:sensor histidine kinase [Bacteroidota bacterium]